MGLMVNTYPESASKLVDCVIDGMLAHHFGDGFTGDVLPPAISVQLVEHYFKFKFHAFQRDAIEHLLCGDNVILHVPTGSGKSVVFQAASRALFERGVTLAVYPLKSLLADQCRSAEANGVTAVAIDGDVRGSKRSEAYRRIATDASVSMVLTTPETLMSSGLLRKRLAARGVALVVIDEAHVYDEWALSFRNSYQKIGSVLPLLGKAQRILLCSATLTAQGAANAARALGVYEWACVKRRSVRPNLKFKTLTKPVVDFLRDGHSLTSNATKAIAPGIAFFSWVRSLRAVAADVDKRATTPALTYHGQMSRDARVANQNDWMQNSRWMLATKAFGMGIDKSNVRTILHAQLPTSILDYAQEVGRAGRDGKDAYCYLPIEDCMGYETRPLGTAAEFLVSISLPKLQDIRVVWNYFIGRNTADRWDEVPFSEVAEEIDFDHFLVEKCVSWLCIAGMLEQRTMADVWEFIFPVKYGKKPPKKTLAQLGRFSAFVRRVGQRKGPAFYVDAYDIVENAPILLGDGTKRDANWRAKLGRWAKNEYVYIEIPNKMLKTRVLAASWEAWDSSDAPLLLNLALTTARDNLAKMQALAAAPAAQRGAMIEKAISLDEVEFRRLLVEMQNTEGGV